jgi:hypothetical protein
VLGDDVDVAETALEGLGLANARRAHTAMDEVHRLGRRRGRHRAGKLAAGLRVHAEGGAVCDGLPGLVVCLVEEGSRTGELSFGPRQAVLDATPIA